MKGILNCFQYTSTHKHTYFTHTIILTNQTLALTHTQAKLPTRPHTFIIDPEDHPGKLEHGKTSSLRQRQQEIQAVHQLLRRLFQVALVTPLEQKIMQSENNISQKKKLSLREFVSLMHTNLFAYISFHFRF